jgi:hypothetical protein
VTLIAPDGRRTLAAGPLTLELDQGSLRYVRLGEREILRRVYVAVRDPRWVTIPMTVTQLDIEESQEAFAVNLTAEHRQGPVHFRWKGSIRGDARGSIRFEMDGEALSTFQRNRIGLCVLHPMDTCAGRPCRVRHADGTVEDSAFPRLVAPHQPFLGVRGLSYEVEPGIVADVQVEGEVFETEDQRNWSDNSFKTYSTPIDLPLPVEVKAGTRIQQAVSVRLVPEAVARRASSSPSSTIDLAIADEAVPLPALGTSLTPRSEPLTARELDRLRALRLAHLRVELVPSRDDFRAAFTQGIAAATALGLPLEVGLWLTGAPAAEVELFVRTVEELRPRLSVVLPLPIERESSPPEAMAALRARLSGVPIAGGANVYFTELNRNRAPAAVADALLFPSTPTVHMMDEPTIAENLAALGWIAETARAIGGGRPLGLSPVLLRPPARPPVPFGGEDLSAYPRHVDPRQASLFLAGWTACHVGHAARAGFARATYYLATGWRGLMYGEAGPSLPADFPAEAGAVYPVYHALADLADLAGGEVLATRSSAPIAVDGVAVRHGRSLRVLLANLTRESQVVRLPAALASAQLRRLDQTNVAMAMSDPEGFRDAPPIESTGKSIVLGPHELARIDVGD